MDSPRALPSPVRFWDGVAGQKHFSHPLNTEWLTRHHVSAHALILDFGCGYGRTLAELVLAGYDDVIGLDFSSRMLARCHSLLPDVSLAQNYDQALPLRNHSVDLVLLFAVLTCLPRDDDQRALLREIARVLRPGGLLYISDLLLNSDSRNLERYARYAAEYGAYGIFELPEGVILRHHKKDWIDKLTASFTSLEFQPFEAATMNGNTSAAFQYLGRAPM
ncbi:MAG: class I SAM-dependent methyltransferase [Candidatus Acidiferrales bacterium]